MQNLTRASRELFRRTPDETFPSLSALVSHCRDQREQGEDHWIPPMALYAGNRNSSIMRLISRAISICARDASVT